MSGVSTNIADLNIVLRDYQELRGMSVRDVLSKQGGKLGREVYHQLLAIAPAKGEIRLEVMMRLAGGRSIKISDKVRAKTETAMLRHWVQRYGYRKGKRKRRSDAKNLNFQRELIKREIGRRESGRRVLAISSRYPTALPLADSRAVSRYSQILSDARIRTRKEDGYAQFRWSGLSAQGKEVLKGIERPRAQAAIAKAIGIVTDDIRVYVRQKQREVITRTVKKMVRPHVAPMSRADAMAEIQRVMRG